MPDTPSRLLSYSADTDLVYQLPDQLQALAEDVERELNVEVTRNADDAAAADAALDAAVATLQAAIALKLDLAGGTLTGTLGLPLLRLDGPTDADDAQLRADADAVRLLSDSGAADVQPFRAGPLYDTGGRVYSANNPPPGSILTGSYTGNGAGQRHIPVAGTPRLVIVANASTIGGDDTFGISAPGVLGANGVGMRAYSNGAAKETSMSVRPLLTTDGGGGFYIGAGFSGSLNENGRVYQYLAIT